MRRPAGGRLVTLPPLVLAYHGLGELPRRLDPHNLLVAPERFERQVRSLLRRGYEVVTISEFARRLADSGPPSGTCALTFDDGSADKASVLPPLLERLGVPATVFVCPGLLGEPHPSFPAEAEIRLMDRDELRAVASLQSFEIGSHTNRHADLSAAGADEAHEELASSKTALEELIERPVLSFAYPGCAYSPACPDAAERAGYVAAVTCGPRGGWLPYELRRESVDSLDRRLTFSLKSRGLWWPLWSSAAGRILRSAARPVRHASAKRPDP
jgi:peptidoglycan/xylan/chitin deacetylase (PgdA/CDA1 family)